MTEFVVLLAWLAWLASGVAAARSEGLIDGVVINRSQGGRPAIGVEVELRAELDGELAPVGRTQTDKDGKFRFRGVPLDRTLTYVAGANVDGVHYASDKFTIGPWRHAAHVRLEVREAADAANPLVIRRHEIVLEPELGALHVTEALLIDNPTSKTFVGRATADAPMPVTFTLGIPNDFERLTFEEEFYGRNFALIGGKVVTSIPWEPGRRWVRFTYSARNERGYRRWQRRIDAPCEQLVIRISGEHADGVACSLPSLDADASEQGQPVFASSGPLAAGEVVWVGLGDLPVSWMAYARWSAVVVLVATILVLSLWMRRRRRREAHDSAKREPPGKRASVKRSVSKRRAA